MKLKLGEQNLNKVTFSQDICISNDTAGPCRGAQSNKYFKLTWTRH